MGKDAGTCVKCINDTCTHNITCIGGYVPTAGIESFQLWQPTNTLLCVIIDSFNSAVGFTSDKVALIPLEMFREPTHDNIKNMFLAGCGVLVEPL